MKCETMMMQELILKNQAEKDAIRKGPFGFNCTTYRYLWRRFAHFLDWQTPRRPAAIWCIADANARRRSPLPFPFHGRQFVDSPSVWHPLDGPRAFNDWQVAIVHLHDRRVQVRCQIRCSDLRSRHKHLILGERGGTPKGSFALSRFCPYTNYSLTHIAHAKCAIQMYTFSQG